MERLNSGGPKTIFRNISCIALIGLIASGRKAWQEEEEKRKDTSNVLILQEQLCYLRALQGHSGCNLIDPTLQDNVMIQSNFFQYIYHVGCAFNLHSIISSGFIPGGQSLSKRQTVFVLSACGWPGGWGPQGRSTTGGGGLARVPNLRVCKHLLGRGVAHAGREG